MKSKARIGAVAGAFAGLMFVVSADAQATDGRVSCPTSVVQQIQHYCSTSWRNSRIPYGQWDDCTQQVFLELLERMPQEHLVEAINTPESEARRELNRAIWRISKRIRRAINPQPLNGYDVADNRRSDEQEEFDHLVRQLDQAIAEQLGPQQNEIVHKLREGHTVGEIARSMNTTPSRVSDTKYRAIKKLQQSIS